MYEDFETERNLQPDLFRYIDQPEAYSSKTIECPLDGKAKKRAREWYKNNKKKAKKTRKQYYEDNKKTILNQQETYRNNESSKARKIKYDKSYYLSHKHKKIENSKIWKKNNLEKRRLSNKFYRWRKSQAIHNFTPEEWNKEIKKTKGICPKCGDIVGVHKLTLDHIIPISKVQKGFIYTIKDVQPLCLSCNSIKKNKIWLYDKRWDTSYDFKHRVIKLQLFDGTWRTYFNINKDKLKRKLIKLQPKNVYTSVSRWVRFSERPTYPNIIIDSDLFIDIDDNTDINYLEKVNKAIIDNFRVVLKRRVRSGTGQYLMYGLKEKPTIPSPHERFTFYVNQKKEVVDFLKEEGLIADYPICADIFRVSRVLGTYNGNKKKWCEEINSLGIPVSKIANKEMKEKLVENQFPQSKAKGKRESETNLLTHYSYNFISNSVAGTKGLYIPVIKWRNLRKRLLKKTIEQYKLGSFVYIKTLTHCYIMFLKCFDSVRIRKLLNYSKSSNTMEFLKYKWNWIPVKGCSGYPVKMKVYNVESNGQYSKPHSRFFDMKVSNTLCGNEDLKVYKAEYKRRN